MSAHLVSKTVIDLLVTAAVKWARAEGPFTYTWNDETYPVTPDTAERVGSMLWLANWEATEGWLDREDRAVPDPPTYVYEPLLGLPPALLVIRQVDYFRYQTAGDAGGEWREAEWYRFLRALRVAGYGRLPLDDMPWGVEDDSRDIFLELGGPDPSDDPPPPDQADPLWEVVDQRLKQSEVPFRYVEVDRRFGGVATPGQRGHWEARWSGFPSMPSVVVRLHDSEEAAVAGYDALVLRGIRENLSGTPVAALRAGRVTAWLWRHPGMPVPEWWFERALGAFPDPDQQWLQDQSIAAHTGADAIATRIPLTKLGEKAGGAQVAWTKKDVEALRAMIDDGDVARALDDIDLKSTTVILLPSVSWLELDGTLDVENLGRLSTEKTDHLMLNIGISDLRQKTGTLIAVDKLPAGVTTVFMRGRLRLPVSRPRM